MRRIENEDDLAMQLGFCGWAAIEQILETNTYLLVQVLHKGKRRDTWDPQPELKCLQKRLSRLLSVSYQAPNAVHGFVKKRSAITNASLHVRRRWVLNTDFRNFFGSISAIGLTNALRVMPSFTRAGVAEAITRVACFRDFLPSGAPSSPVLSNIFMSDLDAEIAAHATGCVYSRLGDDMSFSSDERLFPACMARLNGPEVVLNPEFVSLPARYGLTIHDGKTRLAPSHLRQMVTGLVVNQRVNVTREYLSKVKSQLYECRTRGAGIASERFFEHRGGRRRYREILLGRVSYVGAVRGWDDPEYRRLAAEAKELDFSR